MDKLQFLVLIPHIGPLHIGLLTFGSQGLDYTYTFYAFIGAYIHANTENKIELGLLKTD